MISFGQWSLKSRQGKALVWQHQESNMLSVTSRLLHEHPETSDRQTLNRVQAQGFVDTVNQQRKRKVNNQATRL